MYKPSSYIGAQLLDFMIHNYTCKQNIGFRGSNCDWRPKCGLGGQFFDLETYDCRDRYFDM